MTQAEIFTDKMMFSSLFHIMFSLVCQHPLPLSDSPLEVIATGDQMKCTLTSKKIKHFSGFQHVWIVKDNVRSGGKYETKFLGDQFLRGNTKSSAVSLLLNTLPIS